MTTSKIITAYLDKTGKTKEWMANKLSMGLSHFENSMNTNTWWSKNITDLIKLGIIKN
jgi:hypothetical protein